MGTTTFSTSSNSTESPFVKPCLNSFKAALEENKPDSCVQRALHFVEQTKLLQVGGRTYRIDRNVNLVAIGKAAPGMVQGAENALGRHIVRGIASVPSDTQIPSNLRTRFMFGAEGNLPDEQAMRNVAEIENFIKEVNDECKKGEDKQIILFLISGGGSALLPAPIPGCTLDDKLHLIRILQHAGADIKQLNTVRTALSRLKGGGLARLGHPSTMISLIISDIVGDPIELISSGPTVIPTRAMADPIAVLKQLNVLDQVDMRLVDILGEAMQKKAHSEENAQMDVQNVIVANNTKMLEALADQFRQNHNFHPAIITNRLEGDASHLGRAMAALIRKLSKLATSKCMNPLKIEQCLREEKLLAADEQMPSMPASDGSIPYVLLFGGESTVNFDRTKATKDAKGGRNQELVLAAFYELLQGIEKDAAEGSPTKQFSLFSLGTDGQDGPTDATGAYICDLDTTGMVPDNSSFLARMNQALECKNSYQFWSEYRGGRNLKKTGKTGMNVMDVQIIVISP